MIKKRVFIIGIIFLMSVFLAVTISAITTTCCEKTTTSSPFKGAWCVQIENPNDCATPDNNVPTSCESTPYCKTGTCINSDEGTCMPSPEPPCTYGGGYWSEKPKDEISQCQLGCCFFPNGQTAFVTQIKCQELSSDSGLTTNYRADINTREECFANAMPTAKGACVYEENFQKKCRLITKKECQDMQTNSAFSNVEFNQGYLCSAKVLETNCGTKGGTSCEDDGRIYFKDTCGNLANVYDYSKIDIENYWTYIQEPDPTTCSAETARGSASCGNCDYIQRSTCKPKKVTESVNYGNYICRDLDCADYTGTEFQGRNPNYPRHGESWCATSRGVGLISAVADSEGNIVDKTGGDDHENYNLPGSRYFVLTCSNNEVTVADECGSYSREEICAETEIGETNYKHAACRQNILIDCTSQNKSEDCLNRELRDCNWLETGYHFSDEGLKISKTNEPSGICVPRYAPGFDSNSLEPLQNGDVCQMASAMCVVTYKVGVFKQKKLEKLLAKDFNKMTEEEKEEALKKRLDLVDEKDIKYERCLKASWKKNMNYMCSSLGDCGEKKNYIGREGEKIGIEIIPPAEE